MLPLRVGLHLTVCVALTGPMFACGGESTPGDAPPPDASVDSLADIGAFDAPHGDLAADGLADGVIDQAADSGGDGPDDLGPLWDGATGDASLPDATVLYASTASASSFGLRQVTMAPGSTPAGVAGWTGYLSLLPLGLTGLQEHIPVTPGRPRPIGQSGGDFPGIGLPGELGSLHLLRNLLAGTSGLLLVGPDGSLQTLFEVPGLYAGTLSSRLALDEAGERGAIVWEGKKVLIFRTDGVPLANGAAWAEITPVTPELDEVGDRSLTIVGSWVFALGQGSGQASYLLRAPADGSAALAPLALPPSGGAPPAVLGPELTASAGGSHLVLAGGSSISALDLYLVEVASGKALNVTQAPGAVAGRGESFGYLTARLAISPAGSRVAYVKMIAGSEEILVVAGDGSAQPVAVSDDSRFAGNVATFCNLHFADEDNLLFMGGVSSFELDIYRWQDSSAKAWNLSKGGSSTPPFDGLGRFWPQGAWIGPAGKWLYFIASDFQTDTTDLFGVNRSSFTLAAITNKRRVRASSEALAACPTSGQLYFAAATGPSLNDEEIWVHDQLQGTAAVKLTAMSSSPAHFQQVSGMVLAPACSTLVWTTGTYYQADVWALSACQPAPPRNLTSSPRHVARPLRLTPDGLAVVFASGGGPSTTTLKAVPVAGGATQTLDHAAGYVHIFSVH